MFSISDLENGTADTEAALKQLSELETRLKALRNQMEPLIGAVSEGKGSLAAESLTNLYTEIDSINQLYSQLLPLVRYARIKQGRSV